MADLRSALAALDPAKDEHWTSDGLPTMAAVGEGFTRKQVTTAFPLFTRTNPVLEAPPKAVEQPAAVISDGTKPSVFGMESNEFGGGLDEGDEEDEVYVPPTEEAKADLQEAKASAAEQLADRKAQAAKAAAELDEANRLHDIVVAQEEAMRPPEHIAQQSYLMHFLNATHKQKPEKSQIDKVMERKDGYGRKRPIFFKQNESK